MTEDTQRTAWQAKLKALDHKYQSDPYRRQLTEPRNHTWSTEWSPSVWADHLWQNVRLAVTGVGPANGTILFTATPMSGDTLALNGATYTFRAITTGASAPNPSQPHTIPVTLQWEDGTIMAGNQIIPKDDPPK